jgi:type III secretory pathway component EscV
MDTIEYNSLGLNESTIPDFVESVSNHQYGKKITLKESYATGDFKILEFSNGFYAHVSNYIVNKDFKIELSVKQDAYVALHINQVQAGSEFTLTLNNKAVSYDDKIVTSLFLTGSTDSFVVTGTKGACVNRLKIMIPKAWLIKNLKVDSETLLDTYFGLQEERLLIDSMDVTYRSMVDKVMNTEDNAYYLSITENIVTVITERFFNRLNIKMQKMRKSMN